MAKEKQINIVDLLDEVILPELNGEYEVTIKEWNVMPNENGGYVETILNLPDREQKYLIFPSQVNYVRSCLRRQFGLADQSVKLSELLNKAKETTFKVWIYYNEDVGRTNINFHQPKVVIQEDEVEL